MKAIETKNLSRRFGDRIAVDSLDMSVDEGELFALLGVNGAGKTTTIRMLTGLLPPSGGEAWLLGRSILTDSMQARQLTAVSPQESAVAPKLTVRENLELMAGVYGADRAAAREAAGQKPFRRLAAPAVHRHGARDKAADPVSRRADTRP